MLLDINDVSEIEKFLHYNNLLSNHETIISLAKAGEGNMNYTLRIITNHRSLILKQARPYVEKYPHIPAPTERAIIEGKFYEKIAQYESISAMMPTLYLIEEAHKILVLEDLGESSDYTTLYQPNQAINISDIQLLTNYLRDLHTFTYQKISDSNFANAEMRQLNHEHIFKYPFIEDNSFDLDQVTEGLQQVSMAYKVDAKLKRTITELGYQYLANGNSLLHGDFYPGSWLGTSKGIQVIDPEFCFYGVPEFDLGVMIAHLMLSKQDEDTIRMAYQNYGIIKNPQLLDQFTGVEIMRRLIGLAQLPLSLDLLDKEELLEQAYELIMG